MSDVGVLEPPKGLKVWHLVVAFFLASSGSSALGYGLHGAFSTPVPIYSYGCVENLAANTPQRIDCGFTTNTIYSWACDDPTDSGATVRQGHDAITTSIGVSRSTDDVISGDGVTYLVTGAPLDLGCTVGLKF